MNRSGRSLAAIAFAALGAACAFAAESVLPVPVPVEASATDLVERAKFLDGARVAFVGEAIGDPLGRGGHGWANLSDGSYAIGVWMDRDDLAHIERFGSYVATGDRLRVVGTFHRACVEHGGDLDIHADSVEVLQGGAAQEHPASAAEIALAAALLAVGAVTSSLWRRRERARGADAPKEMGICADR